MKQDILQKNKERRLHLSLPLLICFAMFTFWQMGFIYYVGPALNINDHTPLPISMDNVTLIIVVAYVLSILFMTFLPHKVVVTGRITTTSALLAAIGLFFPFSTEILRLLIYIEVFCCCYLIGYESFLIINLFSEKTAIKHLTLAYGVALLMIAFLQNDFMPIQFPFFRIITVFAVAILLIFYMRMPISKSACPDYVKKGDSIVRPKQIMFGTFIIVFVGSLMGVSGPSISGEITHGIFITYFVEAVVSILIYFLYKKYNVHPFRSLSLCIVIGAIGYLLMIATDYVPSLSYLVCAFIGIGMIACQILPLYSTVLMRIYPSKYYAPITIGLALAAVLVQSSMVEIFRTIPALLYLIYSTIMVILVFILLKYEPHFIYLLIEKTVDKEKGIENEEPVLTNIDMNADDQLLSTLTKREKEVLELISCGYSNADIAKELIISEHTVNDYTKKIYRKLNVHNRHAAAQFLIRQQSKNVHH